MTAMTIMCITCAMMCTQASKCNDSQHCLDCDNTTGRCVSECETGYYDQRCSSDCNKHCLNKKCILSSNGNDHCTDGCVLGYQGSSCNTPCDNPGGNCTACPGGCEGGYCQLGSYYVSGCVDSHFGSGCKTCSSGCYKVGLATALSIGLPTSSFIFIVTMFLVLCKYCQHVKRKRFQQSATSTQGVHASPEVIVDPQYDVIDEANIELAGEGQQTNDSCPRYVELSISPDLEHADTAKPGTTSMADMLKRPAKV